jgi:hypothetical protein
VNDFREDAPTGHHAITDGLKDSAALVTLLADLGHLHDRFPQVQSRSDGNGGQLDASSGDVFRKVAEIDRRPVSAHCLDILIGKQGHLPVPGSCMGISLDAVPGPKPRLYNGPLLHPLAI